MSAIQTLISESDRAAIIRVIGTFPPTSPIILDDLYFASRIDGYSLDHIPGKSLAPIVHQRCYPVNGPYGEKDRASWFRRW